LYKKLFHLKKVNRALHNGLSGGDLVFINSSNEDEIVAFTREKVRDKILAVFNFSDKQIETEIEGNNLHGTYKNYFTGMIETFSDKKTIKLRSWEYRVYVK